MFRLPRDPDACGGQPALGFGSAVTTLAYGGGAAQRNHGVHNGVFVDVHQVEGLAAVTAAGTADGDVEVLGVARGRGDGDRNPGEARGG